MPRGSRWVVTMNFQIAPATGGAAVRRSLTVEQMAALTGLSVASVRTYLTCRRYQHLLPPGFKRPGGRRWLWWADEVEAWMAQGKPPHAHRSPRPRGRPTKAEQIRRRTPKAPRG